MEQSASNFGSDQAKAKNLSFENLEGSPDVTRSIGSVRLSVLGH
jgi:hypothetical protein